MIRQFSRTAGRRMGRAITNVESLVQFLFKHDVYSEDRDYDAAAAAKKRAGELLGIEIED